MKPVPLPYTWNNLEKIGTIDEKDRMLSTKIGTISIKTGLPNIYIYCELQTA
jgi:hypothetical protein